MASRPMRIIFKPYRIKGEYLSEGFSSEDIYWRATTDFPCTKSGKPMYGKGIDKMTALAALIGYLPWSIRNGMSLLTEKNMFVMPDQPGFEYYQVNLDGSVPTKEEWLRDRQFWNTFGHLPFYD